MSHKTRLKEKGERDREREKWRRGKSQLKKETKNYLVHITFLVCKEANRK
jgi:hypothetical protein